MGLLGHLWNGVKDFAENPIGATERFLELNFGSGKVGGTDPAQIYAWFHDGPGTGSYDAANKTIQDLSTSYQQTADTVNSVKQQLASGWQGPASDSAQQQLQSRVTALDGMHTGATDAVTHLGDQSHTFTTTKNSVTQVPQNPPQGGGLSVLNPATMVSGASADLGVADYQQKAHGNQQAYSSYGHATPPQQAGLPQAQGPAPQSSVNTGVDQGQVAAGYQGGTPVQGGYAHSPGGGAPVGGTSAQSVGPVAAPPSVSAPGGGGAIPPPAGSVPSSPGVPAPGPWSGSAPGLGGPTGSGPSGPLANPATASALDSELSAFGAGAAGGAGVALGSGAGGGSTGTRGRFGSSSGSKSVGEPKAGAGEESGSARGAGKSAGASAAAAAAEEERLAGGKGGGMAGVPGGRGGKKKEDEEHKTASYLIHEEHGRELVGELEPVVPEVIGETPDETAKRHGER